MFATLGAIAAGISAATAVGGTVIGSANAQAANKTQRDIAGNAQANAQNSEQYQRRLNAEAMRRGVAGSTNGRGDSLTYDPATNRWVTRLSDTGAQVQNATDQASITRNTRDMATAGRANNDALTDAMRARSLADVAGRDLAAFRPKSSAELEGALQDTSTTANRQAQAPIIADTLRQFARTGTAAAPVLTQMMRDNATGLRQTMGENKIRALENTDKVNDSRRSGLLDNYGKLSALSNPTLNFPNLSSLSPTDALAAEATARANAAAQPASTAAYSNSASTNATTNANKLLLDANKADNTGAMIVAGGKQVEDFFNPNNKFMQYLSGGKNSGNSGDAKVGNFGDPYAGNTMYR